jgi:UbiA prenyltransferase family
MEQAAEIRTSIARVTLELGRVSNLPTVWSNIAAGWILAGGEWDWRFILLLGGGSLLYTAGMFLNDAFDADWDRKHRPERPIPSGRISAKAVGTMGVVMLMTGAAFVGGSFLRTNHFSSAMASLAALVACIVLYNWLHKKTAVSAIVMALCRFFLVGVSAMAAAKLAPDGPALKWALLVAIYVFGITLLARHEAISQRPSMAGAVAVAAPPLAACLLFPLDHRWWFFFLVPALAWVAFGLRLLGRRGDAGRIGRAVSHFLAGVVLIDALAISFFCPGCAAVVVGFLPLTLWLQRHVAAT